MEVAISIAVTKFGAVFKLQSIEVDGWVIQIGRWSGAGNERYVVLMCDCDDTVMYDFTHRPEEDIKCVLCEKRCTEKVLMICKLMLL